MIPQTFLSCFVLSYFFFHQLKAKQCCKSTSARGVKCVIASRAPARPWRTFERERERKSASVQLWENVLYKSAIPPSTEGSWERDRRKHQFHSFCNAFFCRNSRKKCEIYSYALLSDDLYPDRVFPPSLMQNYPLRLMNSHVSHAPRVKLLVVAAASRLCRRLVEGVPALPDSDETEKTLKHRFCVWGKERNHKSPLAVKHGHSLKRAFTSLVARFTQVQSRHRAQVRVPGGVQGERPEESGEAEHGYFSIINGYNNVLPARHHSSQRGDRYRGGNHWLHRLGVPRTFPGRRQPHGGQAHQKLLLQVRASFVSVPTSSLSILICKQITHYSFLLLTGKI